MLKPGLYEQVINNQIQKELSEISDELKYIDKIDSAESTEILTRYLSEVVHKGLDYVSDDGVEDDEDDDKKGKKNDSKLNAKIKLVNKIINILSQETQQDDIRELVVDEKAEQLLGLLKNDPSQKITNRKAKEEIVRPDTSVAQSSLFTGALHEPQLYLELKKEIETADRIDVLVSFIKWSGLILLKDALEEFTRKGGKLRVITTPYTGATDVKAVDELSKLPNTEVRITYDTKDARLHAKAYIFYRETKFTTAYIGSSNMSNVAMTKGLEWNIKITAKDLQSTIKKVEATFEGYWNNPAFEQYNEESYSKLDSAIKAEKHSSGGKKYHFIFDITPHAFQQEILDKLKAERVLRNRYRNLVVAATGTGKTVISALDYKRFCRDNPGQRNRLLFVAHREEILKQSLETFEAVLKDQNFGELFVGKNKDPHSLDYLFVSIQTLASKKLHEILPEDYYDYIVVDEFHHAAAPTYQGLLSHFKPRILLGLTATPERMDGKSVLDYFDGRIAAEIRLPEAVDRKLLCPFQYFGITDEVDLSDVKWVRGGYDKTELSNLYSFNREVAVSRANHIINSLNQYVADIEMVHGLGFCVSIDHAKFMAEQFNDKGIASIALTAESSDEERNTAQTRLIKGELKFIFTVDLFNEGVDIPEVDTILFLRPTESLTIFLQQLGRGLRHADGKECLTVLDFIGQANKKYNFEEKYAALLSNTTNSVQREIKRGFVALPKGCYIVLEKKAKDIILDNIKKSFSAKMGIVSRMQTFSEDTGLELNLANFIKYHRLKLSVIYGKYSFSRLCVEAGIMDDFSESLEITITKALPKIAAIDSRQWILFLLKTLPKIDSIDVGTFTEAEKRMLRMIYTTIWKAPAKDLDDPEIKRNFIELAKCKCMLKEIVDILKIKLDQLDIVGKPANLGFDCPLELYSNYTSRQVKVALDDFTLGEVQGGVKWIANKKIDVFFVTLNKSEKEYSPSTMYDDYSINENLFHWQSQNRTSETSEVGQRYINHVKQGSKVLLFVRESKEDALGTAPYTFLGTAKYVSHTGNKPMSFVWEMDNPIPAKYLMKTNKLEVG